MSQRRIKKEPEFNLNALDRGRIAELQVRLMADRQKRIDRLNQENQQDVRKLDDLIAVIAKEMSVDIKRYQLNFDDYKFVPRPQQ